MDLSDLDRKYFIDSHVFNCPFCKRNNVSYSLIGYFIFDWDSNKQCYGYLVRCNSKGCNKVSLHLSYKELRKFIPPEPLIKSMGHYSNDEFSEIIDLDKAIFYSRPTSFFTLDQRIPRTIRDLVFESEQSRQANLLVGASACLRKAIYELIRLEKVSIKAEKTGYIDYQTSINKLKEKFPGVSSELFDALANIQEMTSDPLHEESWEAWDSPKLRFLTELMKATLDEMYVIPEERKKRLNTLGQLKSLFEREKSVGRDLKNKNTKHE